MEVDLGAWADGWVHSCGVVVAYCSNRSLFAGTVMHLLLAGGCSSHLPPFLDVCCVLSTQRSSPVA